MMTNYFLIIGLVVIFTISITIVSTLVILKIVSWNWITGVLLGTITSYTSFLLVSKSARLLIKTENHYFLYFMFLLRIGVYFITTVTVLLLNDLFAIEGFLIGLVNSIFYPFFKYKSV
ncbi:MG406 family protein [Spiroplasma sabaudiense]